MATAKKMARVIISKEVGMSMLQLNELLDRIAGLSNEDLLAQYNTIVAEKTAVFNQQRENLNQQEAELG